ncbi:hypothetical protein BKA63DRAFT_32045 [Paraphoma chrysanthemicola]|nr:hypothetical protein BKA63DRAFT_32045 [Paraphoma chrysanthemicola]
MPSTSCRECSRRRIKCDASVPHCQKCKKKGLECSGYGFRYRFANSLSSDRQQPSTRYTRKLSPTLQLLLPTVPRPLRWAGPVQPLTKRQLLKRHLTQEDFVADSKKGDRTGQKYIRRIQRPSPLSESSLNSRPTTPTPHCDGNESTTSKSPAACRRAMSSDTMWLGTTIPDVTLMWVSDPHVRMLMSHFSEAVAPIMVVLDCISNGYRDVILPLAVENCMVQRAVAVVAAHHLAAKRPELHKPALAGQMAIISKLRRHAFEVDSEGILNTATLATVLVLLVGDTVTGGNDFVHLLHMLRFLLQSARTCEGLTPQVRDFFQQQAKMFQFFGFPLSQEIEGIRVMQDQHVNYLEFMDYSISPASRHFNTVKILRSAIADAQEIYRRRAGSILTDEDSLALLERLRQRTMHIDDRVYGAHTLVWTYFIAAAESQLPGHRNYFTRQLKLLYRRTGFRSIVAGLGCLERLWTAGDGTRWTELLAKESPVLVM